MEERAVLALQPHEPIVTPARSEPNARIATTVQREPSRLTRTRFLERSHGSRFVSLSLSEPHTWIVTWPTNEPRCMTATNTTSESHGSTPTPAPPPSKGEGGFVARCRAHWCSSEPPAMNKTGALSAATSGDCNSLAEQAPPSNRNQNGERAHTTDCHAPAERSQEGRSQRHIRASHSRGPKRQSKGASRLTRPPHVPGASPTRRLQQTARAQPLSETGTHCVERATSVDRTIGTERELEMNDGR